MYIATEDPDYEDAAQEARLINLERDAIVRRLLFRAMQTMCPCERVILHYCLMADDNDKLDPLGAARMLGCTVRHVQLVQTQLEGKLRVLLRHLVVDGA
jgi:hypothetical protein